MTPLQEIIAIFRDQLAARGSKFLLIYTEENPIAETLDCRVTSNSNREGVRAIMSFLMRPTPEALDLIAQALQDTALSGVDVLPMAIETAAAEGAFAEAAKVLFDELRGHLTIAGWEQPTPNESSRS
jgi:hypothetical protein